MKKWLAFLLCGLLFLSLISCTQQEKDDTITAEAIIAAYEEADCEVWHEKVEESDFGIVYQIGATDSDGEAIYFYICDTVDNAKAYEETVEYNLLIWAYSLISGDPTWVNVERCGTIVIQYEQSKLYKPFEKLIA